MKALSGMAVVLLAGCWLGPGQSHAAPGQSFEEAHHHWSYQPLRVSAPPKVHNATRVQNPVDAFLLSKLEAKGLTLAPPADKATLLRRAYYDLIGQPPTYEEIKSFEADHSRNAFARVLDRLLASPRYGERWGRHWLDVARYADTKDLVLAYGKDALRPYAYTYRDYVIRAFNEDLPYNEFVKDQLSADLAGPNLPRWRLAALGFLTLGRMFDNNPHDQIDDQIDTTTRGFLGMTVACARCHDHKYDAITQKDYYGLYGVFASTERPYDLPLLEEPKDVAGGVEFEQQLTKARQELEQHIDAEFGKLTEKFRQRIGEYLVRAATTPPDISETTQFALSLVPDDFRPGLMQRTRRLLERRANPDDRIFGLWAELMALPDEGFAAACRQKSEEAARVLKEKPAGAGYNPLVVEALTKAALTNKAAVARTYGQLLLDVYAESKKPAAGSPGLTSDQRELLELVTSEESPIWFPRRDTPDHMSRAEKDRYNGLVSNLDKLAANATNAPPARAMVVADLPEPYQPHIFKRGNPSRPGDAVPRAFLQVLSPGSPRPFEKGSGRRELAEAIVSPENPLTARVWVNRVWMHHFGEPLVASTTDFGARCAAPLQGELLDWLAGEFVRSGWSVKHLHRVIMLSSAYQQSSFVAARPETDHSSPVTAALKNDPENKLLWHFPRRRLDFEAMRDSLLFKSGRLEQRLGGRSIDLVTEPLNCRRTVYALVNRQDLPTLFRSFDFPAPDQCAERRPQTSVPQQALFALNSRFVMEQARALAARPEIAGARKPSEKVEALFRVVLGRRPTKNQTTAALRFLAQAEGEPTPEKGLTAWEQLSQVLLISNEAMFVD